MPMMLAAPNICLVALVMDDCISLCGRWLATSVVLMRSSDGLLTPRSRGMLTSSHSLLYVSPSLRIASLASSMVKVRKTKFLSNSGLVNPINSCWCPL